MGLKCDTARFRDVRMQYLGNQQERAYVFDEFTHSSLRNSSSTKDLDSISSSLLTGGRCKTFQEGDLAVNGNVDKGVSTTIREIDLPCELVGLFFVRLLNKGGQSSSMHRNDAVPYDTSDM